MNNAKTNARIQGKHFSNNLKDFSRYFTLKMYEVAMLLF